MDNKERVHLKTLLDTFIYYGKEARREAAKQIVRAETFEACRTMLDKALEDEAREEGGES